MMATLLDLSRLPRLPRPSLRRVAANVLPLLLAILCLLQLIAVLRAPALVAPAQIDISLTAGQALTVGAAELAAPQADRAHLALRRDGTGAWFVANASAGRQLLLQRDGEEVRSGAASLVAGQGFQLGAARFVVDAAGDGLLAFTGPGGRWRYDGATLLRNGAVQANCLDAPLASRLGGAWNRFAPAALKMARPLVFGGNLYCGNRLGIDGVDPQSASVSMVQGRLLLAGAGSAGLTLDSPPRLRPASQRSEGHEHRESPQLLARQEVALAGVTALVAGHTRFAAAIDGDTLHLRPAGHVALYPASASATATVATSGTGVLPAQLHWQWRPRALWNLPGGAAWSVALLLTGLLAAALAWGWQRGRWPFALAGSRADAVGAAASALLGIAGIAFLLLQRAGTPPGAGWSMLLGWAALWCVLLAPGRLRLAAAAALLLLAAGMLAQLELGLGALESSWLRHFQKTASLLAIGMAGATWLRLRWRGRGRSLPIAQARLEWLLVLLAGAALCALAAQVLFGDETGVFDLQPVELAKLALCALSAHCLAIGMGWHRDGAVVPEHSHPLWRWCRLGAPALLFAVLLALALLEVDDFSPLILLLVWSTAMALVWALAARRLLAIGVICLLALGALAAIVWLRLAGAGEVATWTFYADRFLVWLDPASHPHTGSQLLMGARAIAEGGWRGADGLFGLASLGQPVGSALHIPQVQDDFAPAFFLNRHGLAAALGLWLLQALFLIGVLQTAFAAHRAAAQARDFRQAWLGRFCCFALCGGAAFVLGHLLLSWGTNLAIFPIMGQPMSFLSAGGSHLLFFICPLLAFTAISAQTFEEKPSCRSMSNTKC